MMSKDTANRILDALRAGKSFPLHIINEALFATGDLK